MKLSVIIFIISLVVGCESKVISRTEDEPRIFFKQMIEASGLFPLEINVPDTISSMMSGMSSMYQTVSSYFSGSGEEGGGGGSDQSQVVYDEVDVNSRPINGERRRKMKVKRVRKESSAENDVLLRILSLLLI